MSGAGYTCPRCKTVCHHPDDVANRYCGRCHLFAGDPAGGLCPWCRQPPLYLLGGASQAFCGNPECQCFTWDPTRTIEENLTDVKFIDLRFRD